MKKRPVSVTTKAVIVISALLLAVNMLLGSFLLARSRTLIRGLINARMLDIVNTAAALLDGDALESLNEDSLESPEFGAVYDTLALFQRNIDLEFIYAVRDMGDGTFIFLVDPSEYAPSEYGQLVTVTDALRQAALGTPAVDASPYEDSWGRFYSAYSPVFDSAGKVGGVVCVDFPADWYEAQFARYGTIVLLFSLLSLAVGALVVVTLTTRLRARLRAMNSDVGALAADMDALMRELGSPDAVPAEADASADEVGELSRRIRGLRDNLERYIEHTHAQANGMITAMASDYRSVYYIDLDADEGICYRAHSKLDNGLREGEHFPFRETFQRYAERYVAENDREEFLRFISPDAIRQELEKESIVAHRYLVVRDGHESYEMLRMAGVRHPEDRDDHVVHAVGVGFTDVDKETRQALAQRQALSDALAAAENANRAKTAFLSSMSHEIRTPMNAIIGLDSIALSDPEVTGKTREHLEKIGGAAQHLLELINDILDMSRIESGHMTLKSENFSLPELLGQINAMTDSQCREKSLRYECRIEGDPGGDYLGDAMKLRQVLINILGNAVKFTPEGGRVTFRVERTARYGGRATLRFTVSDTGIGMDKSFLPRLFEPFSQEDSSTTSKYGSTGLGMAISKNLVAMMNGTIAVESEKGVGTTFTVTVTLTECEPAAPKPAAPEESETENAVPGAPRKAELEGRRVLLAEDVALNAEIILEVLAMRGIEAEHAENGKEAVKLFSSREPGWFDAVLMDMRMPEMDGLEAAAAIRALDRADAKAVPIIALTANAFDEDVQRSLQAGLNAHLSKPVEPEALFSTLESLIEP